MGLQVKPLIIVGKVFSNQEKAIEYFNSKVALTEDDLDAMGRHLNYWLEEHEEYPEAGTLDKYSDNGEFYIGYDVFDENPARMIELIEWGSAEWKKVFNEEPQLVMDNIYQ